MQMERLEWGWTTGWSGTVRKGSKGVAHASSNTILNPVWQLSIAATCPVSLNSSRCASLKHESLPVATYPLAHLAKHAVPQPTATVYDLKQPQWQVAHVVGLPSNMKAVGTIAPMEPS